MLIIGLTGGIGSGKSTVADYFAQHGIPVIDADQLARELVVPGSPALNEIIDLFGPNILLPDGSLDRHQLRQRVFADPAQKRRLEAILHPRVYTELGYRTQALRTPYCIWVVPLLLETGGTALVDRVLVVDAPESLQRQRVLRRAGMDETTLEAILSSQVNRAERLSAADDVVVNNSDLSQLQQQVTALHHRYLALAGALPPPPIND
jgi:dephospho-CoA kinase